MRKKTAALLAAASLLAFASACASKGSRKDTGLGIRVLEAVVVEREQAAPGSSGSRSYSGNPDYYMVFEAREGDATSRYRLQVTRTQWFRFPEGSRVRITLNNNILQDVRSAE